MKKSTAKMINIGKICSYEGCDRGARTKGMCLLHYKRLWRGTLGKKYYCDSCGNEFVKNSSSQRYCRECYTKKCVGCGVTFLAKYMKARFCSVSCGAIYGNKNRKVVTRNTNGKYINVKINGKWMREHRHIMEKHIGRKLLKTEDVHHKNKDKHDNRIENLQIVQRDHHYGNIECPYCNKTFKIK